MIKSITKREQIDNLGCVKLIKEELIAKRAPTDN